jgi:phosphoglycolate phosphatase
VEATVSRLLAEWRFDAVLGAQPAIPAKPDPAGALQIAERIGAPPAAFLYLGDSGVDMRTAVAAGMYPVGALWGFRTGDELRAAGARTLAEDPSDVMALLGNRSPHL